MADGATLLFDPTAIDRDADRMVRRHLTAGTKAVSGTTKKLERKLETATQAAVPGKLWTAFASKAYPRGGPAKNPAGTIYLNGGRRTHGALAFWTEPGQVRGSRGQWLAIPTPAAGSRGRGRNLTPGEWERSTGQRLRFIYRAGKPGLLVADSGTVVGRKGGYKPFRPLTRARTAADEARGYMRGATTAIIFVLVPMVKHRNVLAIEPIVEATEGELTKQFFDEIRAISGR